MSDAAPVALLAGEELEKEYRTGPEVVRVLRGASVTLDPGEFVTLIGASGVGKSTLLHLLGGLDRPTAGRVLFQGEDLAGRGEAGLARFRRRDVGFVFQFYNLLGDMSALENTMIPALIERKPPREVRDLAAAALGEVGLRDRPKDRPGESSRWASSSAWRSRAPSSPAPGSSSRTSRRGTWIRRPARSSTIFFSGSRPSEGWPSSWPPTIPTSPERPSGASGWARGRGARSA